MDGQITKGYGIWGGFLEKAVPDVILKQRRNFKRIKLREVKSHGR